MPGRPHRTTGPLDLFGEVSARLPLFDHLPLDALQCLSTSGFGRSFLTASLRARLRKAGYRSLSQLARASPTAIVSIRKFGPVRVELVRASILTEVARRLPGAREMHTEAATEARRRERLQDMPVERLPLTADQTAALGCTGWSCAAMASRSRLDLLDTGVVESCDVDRMIAILADLLEEGGTVTPLSAHIAGDTPAMEPETVAARRAALLAKQDREWEEAAPPGD